jgi:hypothetical protein
MNMIKWERYKGTGGGWAGYVFDIPLYRLWFKRCGQMADWFLGVWIEADKVWHCLAARASVPCIVVELKAFAERHFAKRLQPHLASLLRSIEVEQAEAQPATDAEPIILKFPGVAV